ncbi:hypothetical protein BGZ94_007613 [Podila epigama]|nr:hypothetical protein BGZ94_007613 [Podila epigama]
MKAGSPAKATTTQVENKVEVVTVSTAEEAVSFLEVLDSNPTNPTKSSANGVHAEPRELPIFSNPLLANATQANSVPIKSKVARVKAGGKTIQVLRISAPKVDGEVVVMRRIDTDLVNATAMFNAAYPAVSEKMNVKESVYVARKYNGTHEKMGALSGVWELAKEYGIDAFMRPLLEAAAPKPAKEEATTPVISTTTTAVETIEQTVVSEMTIVQETVEEKMEQDDIAEAVEETIEQIQELSVSEVAGLKRRIEELETQVSRDQKKFRGLVTVAVGAVGIAAASVIPQVLPYFS